MKKLSQIVVVDDDPDYCYLLKEALHLCDPACSLKAFQTGTELLAWLSTNPQPNFIFLDINIPGPSGFEILKTLKAVERYKYIPVVMLTTSERVNDVHTAYEMGANAYITKPITFTELLPRINLFSHYWLDTFQPPAFSWPIQNRHLTLN